MGVLSNRLKREDLNPGDHIYSWRHAYLYAHHGIYAGDGKVIHFTRGAGQEIGTGTALDRFIFSSSPSHPSDNPCPNCGDGSRLDGVISSCIDCFLAGGELYRFEYGVSGAFFIAKTRGGTCTLAASDPPEDVLHRASFLLENGFGSYHLFKNNCEDFAIYCKTGLLVCPSISVGRSGQAASFLFAADTVIPSTFRYLRNRFTSPATSSVISSTLRYASTRFSGPAVGFGVYCANRYLSDIGVRRDVTKVPVEQLIQQTRLDEPQATSSAAAKEA